MARHGGHSPSTVGRIWRVHGLKPHLVRTFKLSNDPLFAEKLDDIVGLYVNPPEHGLVLSLDERSQMQALDRTQPGLPLKKGRGQILAQHGGALLSRPHRQAHSSRCVSQRRQDILPSKLGRNC